MKPWLLRLIAAVVSTGLLYGCMRFVLWGLNTPSHTSPLLWVVAAIVGLVVSLNVDEKRPQR